MIVGIDPALYKLDPSGQSVDQQAISIAVVVAELDDGLLGTPEREETELAMTSAQLSIDQIIDMIASGDITDAQTIAALGHLRLIGRL